MSLDPGISVGSIWRQIIGGPIETIVGIGNVGGIDIIVIQCGGEKRIIEGDAFLEYYYRPGTTYKVEYRAPRRGEKFILDNTSELRQATVDHIMCKWVVIDA